MEKCGEYYSTRGSDRVCSSTIMPVYPKQAPVHTFLIYLSPNGVKFGTGVHHHIGNDETKICTHFGLMNPNQPEFALKLKPEATICEAGTKQDTHTIGSTCWFDLASPHYPTKVCVI